MASSEQLAALLAGGARIGVIRGRGEQGRICVGHRCAFSYPGAVAASPPDAVQPPFSVSAPCVLLALPATAARLFRLVRPSAHQQQHVYAASVASRALIAHFPTLQRSCDGDFVVEVVSCDGEEAQAASDCSAVTLFVSRLLRALEALTGFGILATAHLQRTDGGVDASSYNHTSMYFGGKLDAVIVDGDRLFT
jgi:hypothetical protein